MFEQAFKNVDDILWKESGCSSELDYTEQTSWLRFLKYLDGLEQDRSAAAELEGKKYDFILDKAYRWEVWAAPKIKAGTLDHNKAKTGPDLIDFVNGKLFPYLQGFKQKAEAKIRNMGNAGRNRGEHYTPRPLIRAIIKVVGPKVGERVYDGAVGSAGFLCEAFDFMKAKPGLTEDLADIQDKDPYDVILANPPFGGKERKEVQQNFPIRTGETAFSFLQHFIKSLKAGGRGGIVIKNTYLSNTDNASVSLRKKLLDECNLHTVLDCSAGTFIGAGVKTVVLFFDKGIETRKVWFYQLDPGRNMGKTNPLNDDDLAEFIKLQKTKGDSPKSWSLDVAGIDKDTFDLSVKNPNGGREVVHRAPTDILDEIAALDAESADVLARIRELV